MQNQSDQLIRRLNLTPHPEGGHYRQTWIANASDGNRPAGTCIYFLLKSGEVSRWHRVDAVEIWHYYAGAPLILSMAETEAGPARDYTLGPDVLGDEAPQLIVPNAPLAGRPQHRRLYPCRLHRYARISFRRVRDDG